MHWSLSVCKLVPSSRKNDLQNPINMRSFSGLWSTTNKRWTSKTCLKLCTRIWVWKNLLWCRWVWCIELVDNSCWKFCITYLQMSHQINDENNWSYFLMICNTATLRTILVYNFITSKIGKYGAKVNNKHLSKFRWFVICPFAYS